MATAEKQRRNRRIERLTAAASGTQKLSALGFVLSAKNSLDGTASI